MKKILLLMILTSSNARANNNCLIKDYSTLTKQVSEAKKLKDDKNPMAQIKYKKIVVQILKSITHIKENHYNGLNRKQSLEIIEISNTFTK